ncbi:unnamed protein product [Trichobilharzia szidati]|nr:unnamed protein product [Trichobilharzia szidati]
MESTTEIVSTTVDHPIEVKSEGVVEPNATATITTSSITIETKNQNTEDNKNIEEHVTSVIKQTIVINPEPVASAINNAAESLPQTMNESNLTNGDDQSFEVIKETVVTVVKDEIRKVVTEETRQETEALPPTQSPIIEILEEPEEASRPNVDDTAKEEPTVTSTDAEVIEPVLTETVVKRNTKDKTEAESTEQDLSDPKYPQRPPPPKLSEPGKRTQTLSTSPSNDVITNGYKRPSLKSNLKHAFSNLRKSFKRKDQTPNPNDFQKSTHRNNYQHRNNTNVDNDYRHGDVYKTSDELQESLSNVQSLDPSINDSPEFKRHSDNNNYQRDQNELEAVNSLGNIAPPAIPTKMSADPSNPIYVNHSLQSSVIDKKANDPTDYPGRLRERIHVYRPVSASGGVMAGTLQYDEYSRNGTLKPRRPKPIAEHYKCSEVYNWPPKFPKLKRRKTHPPKQIHTGQDHVVIKSQSRQPVNYQATTVTNQTRPSEPIQYIKVSPQSQTMGNNKRDSSYSPERQVTSLHSLQRSTLLEKSNRTVEPGSRDQLFIADYKHMPSDQMSSDKSNHLALPYFTRIAENKRLGKFNFNYNNNAITAASTQSNNNNNIVVSADIIQSESPKALSTLKDTLKSMHPFLQDWIDKNDKVNGASHNDEQKKSEKLLINCLSEYLYTCMKLRSLDLQGEYAAFIFPLKHFNEKAWNNYGAIEGWEDLSIVCAPNTNNEYVVLKGSNNLSNKLKYTRKTIDKLLTNWLDNQTTKSPIPATNGGHKTNTLDQKAKASSPDEKILHSIFTATTLKSVLSLDDKEKQPDINIQILVNCIKLGVLLSLSECLHITAQSPHDINTSVEFDLKPENILLILSASNCLTIFKPYAKLHHPADHQTASSSPSSHQDEAKSETHEKDSSKDGSQNNNTLKSLFTNLHINHGESINEVINETMKQLHELAKHEFQASPEVTTSLLKAIAPPDWIAMTLARICLYNQQTTS